MSHIHFENVIAQSPKMQQVLIQIEKFANLNAPLLIVGETGTGKDVLAKLCHDIGARAAHPFLAINCAGLPEAEAETEMFGSRSKGENSIGFFESAQGGTVLLDSVAELSLEMQGKLLRFLNDGSFRRVGEDREIRVDVRVICTAQHSLSTWVEQGKMREDLYHRLNVLSIQLPPLRERKDDLPLLVEHFLNQIAKILKKPVPTYDQAFLQVLKTHYWRGNLRELYNALYRACSLALGNKLNVVDLHLSKKMEAFQIDLEGEATLDEMMNCFEASLLRKFYTEFPSTRKLAQRLGVSHTSIANKLRQYGIAK